VNKQNPFADLEALRRATEAFHLDEPRSPHRRKQHPTWQRYYIMLPWTWVDRLQKARGVSTWRVAVLLLYEHWRRDGQPIVVSNVLTQDLGVPRRSKARALVELQALDLIVLDRGRGKSPRATLKHLKRD
jgi:hypothetical protein